MARSDIIKGDVLILGVVLCSWGQPCMVTCLKELSTFFWGGGGGGGGRGVALSPGSPSPFLTFSRA